MSQQIQITGGAKVRNLQDVIIGTSGVLSSVAFDVANGVPRLDVNGKILVSQLPNSVMEYKGTWNAATNTPTLVNGTGNQGDVYLCNVAGTVDFGAGAIAFVVGDQVIYSGSIWQRASGATGTVTSVAVTETGDSLNITGSPITTSGTINIGFNGTNLQYVNGAGNLTTFPDLSVYVTLAGTQTITGSKTFSATSLTLAPSSGGGTLNLKQDAFLGATNGYTSLTSSGSDFAIIAATGVSTSKQAVFSLASLGSTLRTYTLPDASGTIALTSDIPILTGYVPYTGATANVDLGTFNLTADVITGATGSFASNGGSDTFAINHSSGAGIALNITKGGNGEGLYINKTSGSGNAATIIGTLNATTLVKSGGTSSQFLKADGTVDSSTYALDSAVVHNTGNETVGGTKTFSDATKNNGGIFLQVASSGNLAGYMNIGAFTNGIRFTSGAGISNTFTLPSSTGYTFTFPNATGTIALTSDIPSLTGYVNTSGSPTTNTLPKFTAASTIGNSNITDTGSLITLGSNSFLNGNVGIGISPASTVNLYVSRAITGGVNAWAVYGSGTIQSDVTAHAQIFRSDPLTAASAFTLSQLSHFNTNGSTLGAGSSITTQNGYFVGSNFIQGTNNYGFRGFIPSGTNRWNLYMDGTANNYMAGSLGIGTTSIDTTVKLHLLNSTTGYVGLRLEAVGTYAGSDWTLYASSNPFSSSNDFLGFYNNSTTDSATVGYKAIITKFGTLSLGTVTPNDSAKVQIDSTTQGVLLPRMTATQRAAIASPAEGLIVVQTDGTQGLYLYIGAAWHAITML